MKQESELAKNMDKIKKNHPDCVPIFFIKHPESTANMKKPQHPMVLFKKQFKIQQAMIQLYNQVQFKGLYFFCPYLVKKKKKSKKNEQAFIEEVHYHPLQQGHTIEQVYKRFGRAGYLTIVYGDQHLGMGGLIKFEKWMIRGVVLMGIIWAILFLISYMKSSSQGQQPNTISSESAGMHDIQGM